MAFNGSGTFNRLFSWVTQAGLGQKIRSDQMDQDTNDIATGLSTCMLKDGTQTVTANIPMNSKKFTGLANGAATTDSAAFGQLQSGSTQYAAAAGTNTITAAMTPTVAALTDGMEFKIKAAATNTAAATFQPDSIGGNLAVVLQDGTALVGGEMILGGEYTLRYRASNTTYQLLNASLVGESSGIMRDKTDITKKLKHILSGITTATIRAITWPDADLTVVGTTTTQTLSGKTMDTGTIATTQATHENSTKLATTAYTDRAAYLIEQNSKSAAYTTVLADNGEHIYHPVGDNNARTFTIDSNANVAYPIGACITFINEINTVTIAITSDTLVQAGTGSTGSRTLAANGMATAIKVTSTRWYISGTGLT